MKIYISQKNKLYTIHVFRILSIFDNLSKFGQAGPQADPRRDPGGPQRNFLDFGQKLNNFTPFFGKNNIKSRTVQNVIFLTIKIRRAPPRENGDISGKFRGNCVPGVYPGVILHFSCVTKAFYGLNSDLFSEI